MQALLPVTEVAVGVSWKRRAQNSNITLYRDAFVQEPGCTYPNLGLNPDVLQEAQGKLEDVYFVGFQNVVSAIEEVLKKATPKIVGMATRALQYFTCWQLALEINKGRFSKLAGLKPGQIFVPFAMSDETKTFDVDPHVHIHSGLGYRVESLGYSPSYTWIDIKDPGKLLFWNIQDSGCKVSDLIGKGKLKGYIKSKHYQNLDVVIPQQDPNQQPFFVYIDKAVAHSASGIVTTSENAKRWVHFVSLMPYTPGTKHPQIFYDSSKTLAGKIRSSKYRFIQGFNREGSVQINEYKS